MMYAKPGIERAPLQTYVSATLFAPTNSILRQCCGKPAYLTFVERAPRTAEFWNAQIQSLEGHSSAVTAVQFSPDGNKLASASHDGDVMIWHATTGALLHTMEEHSGAVTAVQFSPDGSELASSSLDGTLRVWNATTGALLHTMEGHSDGVTAVQFSPDGNKLASASHDKKVIVWNVSAGVQLQTLEGHAGGVTAVQFSPDGSKLASASDDKRVIMWDVSTGVQQHTLEGHAGGVTAVQFSPDGSKLASASDDGKVIVWDLNRFRPTETINVEGYVSDLAFSTDGSYIKTDFGSFKLKSTVGATYVEDGFSLHLQVREEWILRHGRRTIWLPPELRPYRRASSVRGNFMALGHLSGTVSFWEISA
jgi:WD40 repeat protein